MLEVADLSSGYGRMTILHGLSLSAAAGEITCLFGPNGAGKSTLMKTIAGQLTVMGGSIRANGTPLAGLNALQICRLSIGYVPQERNVFTGLTVNDNLQAASLAFPHAGARVDEVFRRFPILKERSQQLASTLSGGERQTLAIATALLAAPKILLLDEPTAGLAPLFVDRIVSWIRELAAEGLCIVWVVEQNPEKILSSSRTTFILEAGRIKDVLDSRSLLEPGRLEQAML